MSKYFENSFAVQGNRTKIDEASIDYAISYTSGYTPQYELDPTAGAGGRYIERDKFNQLMYDVTSNIKEWQENSFPDWILDRGDNTPFPYGKGAVVHYKGKYYVSLSDANNKIPTDATKWSVLDLDRTSKADTLPIGTIVSYVGSVAPNGWLFCDGTPFDKAKFPELAELLKEYIKRTGTASTPNLSKRYLKGALNVASVRNNTMGDSVVGGHNHRANVNIPDHRHAVGTYKVEGSFSQYTNPGGPPFLFGSSATGAFSPTGGKTQGQYRDGGNIGSGGPSYGAIKMSSTSGTGFSGLSDFAGKETIGFNVDDNNPGAVNDVQNFEVNFIIKAKMI